MDDERSKIAEELFTQAYRCQMSGQLELAVTLYKQSIKLYPTAEAYTFLGWTYRGQGLIEEAIEACKSAILIDPTFGNPYNDIGSYLIDLKCYDDAIPWLEKAIAAKRYESYHYPWYNLGRVYLEKEMYNRARECFTRSLDIEPRYSLAANALHDLRRLLQ